MLLVVVVATIGVGIGAIATTELLAGWNLQTTAEGST